MREPKDKLELLEELFPADNLKVAEAIGNGIMFELLSGRDIDEINQECQKIIDEVCDSLENGL